MTNEMGRVLVTGATGFVGLEVARRLCERDLAPRLLVRRPLRGALLASLGAELMQGDLESPESLTRAVQGIDTVIHLGARAIFEEYELVRPTIVDGSVALMHTCVAAGVRRFVYASSLLVYQDQEAPVDQRTPAFTRHGYGRAKIEAERALTQIADQAGIELAILRLPHVYGVRDLMFSQVRHGLVFFPGNGRNLFAHLHVADAARLLVAAAETGWTGISPVADDLPVNWNDFFAEIRKYYPRFRSIGTPEALALLGTSLLTPIRRLSRYPSLYTPDAVRGWNVNITVKPGLVWDDLGMTPTYPSVYQGIPAVIDDCLEFHWVHPIADRVG
jgi:nucleoside-diphosphate-sugar epimerase